jgi:uncharacterized protein (DUF1684 family)
MDMSGFFPLLWWALGGATVLGGCVYLFMEYQAYLLRTKIINVPGGLRFVSQNFAVEVRHAAKEIMVVAKDARVLRQALPDGDEQVETGALTVTLAAAGLRIEVARVSVKEADAEKATPTGVCRIVLAASDERLRQVQGKKASQRTELRLDQIPDPIAADFQQFANGLRAWIDKIEHRLAAQAAEQRRQEEIEAAKAAGVAAAVAEDPTVPLSEEERQARATLQLEKWRREAGFKGNASEMHVDARGRIEWLIELDPTGRAILHAGDRTFHGSLKGATVTGIGSEIEVAVRDDYWSEDDPQLVAFRVLGGAAPEVRRAWKERLDILVQSLGGHNGQRR